MHLLLLLESVLVLILTAGVAAGVEGGKLLTTMTLMHQRNCTDGQRVHTITLLESCLICCIL